MISNEAMRTAPCREFRTLSLAGGGVRGIITATVLSEIEKWTQTPISKLFDLIAGTSTGGLIAMALTAPGPVPSEPKFSARVLVDGYNDLASKIFYRDWWWCCKTALGIEGPKYPTSGIENVAEQYFGPARISDALTKLAIPSYEVTEDRVWTFSEKDNLPMKDVLRATTAAPIYFSPKELTLNGVTYNFVDGGMAANNPAAVALSLTPKQAEVFSLSIGTGAYSNKIAPGRAKNWGAAGWIFEGGLIETIFDGSSQATDLEMRRDLGERFISLQTPISEKHSALDNASESNLRYLAEQARIMIENNEELFRDLCHKLEKGK